MDISLGFYTLGYYRPSKGCSRMTAVMSTFKRGTNGYFIGMMKDKSSIGLLEMAESMSHFELSELIVPIKLKSWTQNE